MVSITDVERIALGLPEVEEGSSYGNRAWKVSGNTFVRERPLRRKDLEELGESAPGGVVIGVSVPDELAKQVLCENEGPAVFVTSHFDGYNMVLIDLDTIAPDLLEELVADSWRTLAPRRLLDGFDADPSEL